MTLVLAPTTSPAVAALASVLFKAYDSMSVQSGPPGWPCMPLSLDFSQLGDVNIAISGRDGTMTISFTGKNTPIVTAALDLADLESQLVSTPNFISAVNDGAGSDAGALSGGPIDFAAPPIVAQKSGVMFVVAQIGGTQNAQDGVTVQLYRDLGTSSQVALGAWQTAPGSITGYGWAASISAIDVLPDKLPHTYSMIVSSSGGATLVVPVGGASIRAFELGCPA